VSFGKKISDLSDLTPDVRSYPVLRHLVQVPLRLIGQLGLGHFFRYRPLLPIDWWIVQILRQRRRKTTNTAPTTLSAIQAASKFTFYQ
jgi:hypothetical protein